MLFWEIRVFSSPLWFDSIGVLREQRSQSSLLFDSNFVQQNTILSPPCDLIPVVFWEYNILYPPCDSTPMVFWEYTVLSSPHDLLSIVFWENTVLILPFDLTPVLFWVNSILSFPLPLTPMVFERTLFSVPTVILLQLCLREHRSQYTLCFDSNAVMWEQCSQSSLWSDSNTELQHFQSPRDLSPIVFWDNIVLSHFCNLNPMVF